MDRNLLSVTELTDRPTGNGSLNYNIVDTVDGGYMVRVCRLWDVSRGLR